MATLYDITGDLATVLNLAEDGTVDPEVIHDTLDSLQGEFDDKAVGYVKVIKQIESDAETIDIEIKRLIDRRNSFKRNADTMKQVLKQAMLEINQTKIKTPLFTISVAGDGGVQPVSIDTNNLQADVWKINRVPDKDEIRRRLLAGDTVLGAELKPRGDHLSIR